MSNLNFQSSKKRFTLLLCGLLALASLLWVLSKLENNAHKKSDTHSTSALTSRTAEISSTNAAKPSQPTSQEKVAEKPFSTIPASNSLAWMQSMAELLQQAPRAENIATRSFAVYMPASLCTSLSTTRINGHSTLEADIPGKPIPYNERGLERVASRCNEFKAADKLRGPVIAGLKAENAPLAAFFSSRNGAPEVARTQLARVLADHDPTALQPLAMVWPFENTERIANTLPAELKPYAQGITTAAFDIALCRAGAYCGADSIALDMVCAKFAECDATNVEDAYRRLHGAAGISFAETNRIADDIRNAIQRRDVTALWPDTAKFPSTRK